LRVRLGSGSNEPNSSVCGSPRSYVCVVKLIRARLLASQTRTCMGSLRLSGFQRRIVRKNSEVSEEHVASIFGVRKVSQAKTNRTRQRGLPVFPGLVHSSTPKMEEICPSETSISLPSTQRQRSVNLKSSHPGAHTKTDRLTSFQKSVRTSTSINFKNLIASSYVVCVV
jgi:hypothetical protein